MRKLLVVTLLTVSFSVFAQYTDKVLYEAFLKADMSVWGKYIQTTDWESLDTAEKQRYLGYEYGYVATAIAANNPQAEQILATFEQHIESLKSILTLSNYRVYHSAAAAYHISLNNITMLKYGPIAIRLAKEAVEIDPQNPLALTLKANIDFYCPKALGGDKARALRHLLDAEKQWEALKRTENNWNYISTKLCIAQCYEKLGHTDWAIRKCEEILRIAPNYIYVAEDYLPVLRGEKTATDTHAGGQVAGKILK